VLTGERLQCDKRRLTRPRNFKITDDYRNCLNFLIPFRCSIVPISSVSSRDGIPWKIYVTCWQGLETRFDIPWRNQAAIRGPTRGDELDGQTRQLNNTHDLCPFKDLPTNVQQGKDRDIDIYAERLAVWSRKRLPRGLRLHAATKSDPLKCQKTDMPLTRMKMTDL